MAVSTAISLLKKSHGEITNTDTERVRLVFLYPLGCHI